MLSISIPETGRTDIIADWAEIYVLVAEERELSKSELSSYIEESSGSEPPEEAIADVWRELEFRLVYYGDAAPYEIERHTVRSLIDKDDLPEYLACLIFSLFGNPIETVRSGKLFERISSEAIQNYINGTTTIYGAPSNIENVEQLAGLLNEEFRQEPPPERQDRNLDIVAWKPFADSRGGQIILLIQCAAGYNWPGKLKELNVGAWRRYINFLTDPIRGFSLPQVITDLNKFKEISYDGGVIIDRARIYRNTVNMQLSDANLREELITWCKQRIEEETN